MGDTGKNPMALVGVFKPFAERAESCVNCTTTRNKIKSPGNRQVHPVSKCATCFQLDMLQPDQDRASVGFANSRPMYRIRCLDIGTLCNFSTRASSRALCFLTRSAAPDRHATLCRHAGSRRRREHAQVIIKLTNPDTRAIAEVMPGTFPDMARTKFGPCKVFRPRGRIARKASLSGPRGVFR